MQQNVQKNSGNSSVSNNFVLEKSIFSNIFEKDIKRVYIYKKAERLAKAIHLVTPAFKDSPALRDRLDLVAVGLIDAATMTLGSARGALSRELLALSSVLSIARSSGMLSDMNADLIAREAQHLLQEVAAYEEPRLALDEAPTLAEIAKGAVREGRRETHRADSLTESRDEAPEAQSQADSTKGQSKGQTKDTSAKSERQEALLDVLKNKGALSIKDLSAVIRDVSEKTIQRELQVLIAEGVVEKAGDRRWTTYSLVAE